MGLSGSVRLIAAVALYAAGLGALTATTVAWAGATPGAADTTTEARAAEWQVAYSTHGGASKSFSGITAPAKDDAWAVGNAYDQADSVTSVFAHWDGTPSSAPLTCGRYPPRSAGTARS